MSFEELKKSINDLQDQINYIRKAIDYIIVNSPYIDSCQKNIYDEDGNTILCGSINDLDSCPNCENNFCNECREEHIITCVYYSKTICRNDLVYCDPGKWVKIDNKFMCGQCKKMN